MINTFGALRTKLGHTGVEIACRNDEYDWHLRSSETNGGIRSENDHFTPTSFVSAFVESFTEGYDRAFETQDVIPDWAVFQSLLQQWHEERGVTSSTTKMAMCPSYQRIIGMGEKAIPLILRQLVEERDDPDHWFWALKVLTDADPVREEYRGDMNQMARAWLAWGASAGYGW